MADGGLVASSRYGPVAAGRCAIFRFLRVNTASTCAKCHSVIPASQPVRCGVLGLRRAVSGRLVRTDSSAVVKFNLVDSSENQGDGPNGQGLPKFIVDEIEAVQQRRRSDRAQTTSSSNTSSTGPSPDYCATLGSAIASTLGTRAFQSIWRAVSSRCRCPVDPETFRDTYQDYTPYVQTVGANPLRSSILQVGDAFGRRRSAARR